MTVSNDGFFHVHEFKGVVLAGGSDRMLNPLTKGICKALLPVYNKPMIWYPLSNLVKNRIREIYVFCEEVHEESIKSYIDEAFRKEEIVNNFGLDASYSQTINVLGIKDSANIEVMGTWSTLVEYGREYLKNSDFFVLTCDVIGQLDLLGLANKHRLTQAVCSVLLVKSDDLWGGKGEKFNKNAENHSQTGAIGGISLELQKSKNRSVFAMDEKKDVILFMKDYYSSKEEDCVLELSKLQLFWHPNIILRTNLTDLHVYIFKSSIFNLEKLASGELKANAIEYPEDGIDSIRLELIPYLAKMQHFPGSELWGRSKFDCNSLLDDENFLQKSELCKYTKANPPPVIEGTCVTYHIQDQKEENPCVRANTMLSYFECNMTISNVINVCPEWLFKSGFSPETGKKVVLGLNCNIGRSVQLKKCFIGNNVTIGDGSKIMNCIIMDNATIGQKCTIQNSIVGFRSVVNGGCKLTYSVVNSEFQVEANLKSQGEILEEREDFFEIKV
ncbi:hypothetical protein FG386_002170 [Cryptosporidium ryanae]|uniref:uncharacterized protein n=1 Tax=Cryptosporidium ryanae TaxID=515981 RepID=UPI00351A271D|nr:hypothetical protein FG386_002170 [Cryptosporidium ryanae]